MKIVILDKVPFLRMCREVLTLEFGLLDYDDLLDHLCEGIHSDGRDRLHIRDMVYSDSYFQGHHERYTDYQKDRMFSLLMDIRAKIVRQIHQHSKYPKHQHIKFIQTESKMSLRYEVFE